MRYGRRDRRNRNLPTSSPSTMAAMGPPGSMVGPAASLPMAHHATLAGGSAALGPLPQDTSAKPTGIGAWLPPEGVAGPRKLEFRVHVRQGARGERRILHRRQPQPVPPPR